jgi:transcription elongation factor Elf1
MKIKKILNQYRRDFTAIYECDHCGHEHEGHGYDDEHFHRNVIPGMVCQKCGLAAGVEYRALTTKYPEGMVI